MVGQQFQQSMNHMNMPNHNQQSMNHNMTMQQQPGNFFQNSMGGGRTNSNAKPPQRQSFSAVNPGPPSEFFFEYNFDEYGILYHLGTMGRRRNWQNPHTIRQVHAFASSLSPECQVESFVGRTTTNCRTEDDPYSFFGVDLGMERKCLPTHYSLRNRDSTTHVVRSWYFEASEDGQNWQLLDVRLYGPENKELTPQLEQEHKDLRQRGGTMTCMVDTDIYTRLDTPGFRFFRIV